MKNIVISILLILLFLAAACQPPTHESVETRPCVVTRTYGSAKFPHCDAKDSENGVVLTNLALPMWSQSRYPVGQKIKFVIRTTTYKSYGVQQ